MFLVVYSWLFIGDTISLVIPALSIDMVVLTPFKSLKFVTGMYFVLAVFSFIVWIVGTILLQLSVFCESTAPVLYQYSLFLIAIYWMGFIITVLYVIKLFCGNNITKMIKESTRASTIDEVEDRIFRKKFAEYDKLKEEKINIEDLIPLLEGLGVFVPPEEQEALKHTLDEEETGYVRFKSLYAWFKKLNADMDANNATNADIDNEGEGGGNRAEEIEAQKMFSSNNKE